MVLVGPDVQAVAGGGQVGGVVGHRGPGAFEHRQRRVAVGPHEDVGPQRQLGGLFGVGEDPGTGGTRQVAGERVVGEHPAGAGAREGHGAAVGDRDVVLEGQVPQDRAGPEVGEQQPAAVDVGGVRVEDGPLQHDRAAARGERSALVGRGVVPEGQVLAEVVRGLEHHRAAAHAGVVPVVRADVGHGGRRRRDGAAVVLGGVRGEFAPGQGQGAGAQGHHAAVAGTGVVDGDDPLQHHVGDHRLDHAAVAVGLGTGHQQVLQAQGLPLPDLDHPIALAARGEEDVVRVVAGADQRQRAVADGGAELVVAGVQQDRAADLVPLSQGLDHRVHRVVEGAHPAIGGVLVDHHREHARVAVVAVAAAHAGAEAVAVGVQVVDQAVAVVVDEVTGLHAARVGRGLLVVAVVVAEGEAVAVFVQAVGGVAGTGGVEVVAELRGARVDRGVRVVAVAGADPVAVGVFVALVVRHHPVAVVVHAVAALAGTRVGGGLAVIAVAIGLGVAVLVDVGGGQGADPGQGDRYGVFVFDPDGQLSRRLPEAVRHEGHGQLQDLARGQGRVLVAVDAPDLLGAEHQLDREHQHVLPAVVGQGEVLGTPLGDRHLAEVQGLCREGQSAGDHVAAGAPQPPEECPAPQPAHRVSPSWPGRQRVTWSPTSRKLKPPSPPRCA